jgi:hypothetical protein
MARGQTSSRMVTFIPEIMLLGSQMALASIGGAMGLLMLENLRKALSLEKANGKRMKVPLAISTKEVSMQI